MTSWLNTYVITQQLDMVIVGGQLMSSIIFDVFYRL